MKLWRVKEALMGTYYICIVSETVSQAHEEGTKPSSKRNMCVNWKIFHRKTIISEQKNQAQ